MYFVIDDSIDHDVMQLEARGAKKRLPANPVLSPNAL